MLKKNTMKKLFVSLMVALFSISIFSLPIEVKASEIETKAVYNYNVSKDHILGDNESNVRVTLTISHNMTLKITSVSTTPKKGGEIKGNYVTVTVKYSIPGIGSWEDNFNIVI